MANFSKIRGARFPCGGCKSNCSNDCVHCSLCKNWYHNKCQEISDDELKMWGNIDLEYVCVSCRTLDGNEFDYLMAMHCLQNKIGLQIKANLEKLTNLHPSGEDFRWYVHLRCANCGEETKEFQYLTLTESSPLKGGRGQASLVIKCHLCSRENSIDIIKDSVVPYNAEDSNKFKTVVVFDCRGVEPIDFSPRVGFAAEGEETGTPFPEISLTEGDWCDYDEKANESVGVYEMQHQFVSVKK